MTIRQSDSRSGVMMVALIITVLILAMLSGGFIFILGSGMMTSMESMNSSTASMAADTGLSLAKAYIATNSTWYSGPPVITGLVGGATFRVTCANYGNRLDARLTSVGTDGVNSRTRECQYYTREISAYAEGGSDSPRYRLYSNMRGPGPEYTASHVAGVPQWQRVVASPVTNEFILVSKTLNFNVWAQVCTGGVWWAATNLTASGGSHAVPYRSFDVTYQSQARTGMVLYATSATQPEYRTWNGTSWSAPGTLTIGAGAYPIQWVRLAPDPRSNRIMALVRRWDSGGAKGYSYASVWSGVGWGAVANLEAGAATGIGCESMDAAWQTNRALVVYVNGGNGANGKRRPKYKTYTIGTSTWSGESQMTSLGADGLYPRWIRVESDSAGIGAFAAFLSTPAAGAFQGAHWNGSAWGAYNTFNNAALATNAYRCFDIAWSSQTNTLMVNYYTSTTNACSYMVQTAGGTPTYGYLPPSPTASAGERGNWAVLKMDPYLDQFMCRSLDTAGDLNVHRWDGTAWQLILETETNSISTSCSLDSAFRRTLPAGAP